MTHMSSLCCAFEAGSSLRMALSVRVVANLLITFYCSSTVASLSNAGYLQTVGGVARCQNMASQGFIRCL